MFLILVWIFITNDDVNSENLGLHGPASAFLTISTTDMVSQNYRNFYSSNSNYNRCMIFTSRYMFSKQAKTTELVHCQWAKLPNMQYGHHFAKHVCDTISNNMKLMLINAETNAALKLHEETVFLPQGSVPSCSVFVARWHQYNIWVHLLLVIKHEPFWNVTPAYITYLKICSIICMESQKRINPIIMDIHN